MKDVRTVDLIADALRAHLIDVPLREDTIEEYAEHIDRDLSDYADALRAWELLTDALELLPPTARNLAEAAADEIQADYQLTGRTS